MTIRRHPCTLWTRFALVVLLAASAVVAVGCAGGGKRGWFSKEPEPPQTIADFMKQPRPK